MDTSSLQPSGDYPPTWARTVFDKFTTLKRGKDLTRDQFRDGSVPVAGSNGVMGFHDTANVKAPGITVGRSGSVGRVTFFTQDFWAHNTALFVDNLHGNDARFAAYFLAFLKLSRFGSGASVPTLDRNSFRLMPVIIPPLAEQRKIAGVLGLVQRAMEQQEHLLARTLELRRSLLTQLFTHGLRGESQKQTDIGPIPKSWNVIPLGSLAKVGNGSTPKRDNGGYWEGGTIPWLNSTKIHERFIVQADQFVTDLAVKECHLPRVQPNSLLIAITGQGKTLGNSALVSFETTINQHLAYAQFTSSCVVPEFVLWFMQTRYEHLRSISQGGGSTKGALTCGFLKTYPIPVPSLDEQRKIAEVFATLDRKEKVHQRKHAALKDLFRTLLHELMMAQIRVDSLNLPELFPGVKAS